MMRSLGPRTLVYPHPVFLVGSYDARGVANIMTAAWAGICCSQPPCVAVSLRKATHTHGSIVRGQAFTVNIPRADQVREADYAGIYSGRDTNKLEALGLTALRSDLVDAPLVAECPVVLECKLVHTFELGLHTQFVGQIVDVKADESVLGPNGLPEITKVDPLIYASGEQCYYRVGERVGPAFSIGRR